MLFAIRRTFVIPYAFSLLVFFFFVFVFIPIRMRYFVIIFGFGIRYSYSLFIRIIRYSYHYMRHLKFFCFFFEEQFFFLQRITNQTLLTVHAPFVTEKFIRKKLRHFLNFVSTVIVFVIYINQP